MQVLEGYSVNVLGPAKAQEAQQCPLYSSKLFALYRVFTTQSLHGLDAAGTGSLQRQSAGTSRSTRSPATPRSRPGQQALPRRHCRSSWRASGGRRPTGASIGAPPASLRRVGPHLLNL